MKDELLIKKIEITEMRDEVKKVKTKRFFRTEEHEETETVLDITSYNLYYRIDEDRFWYVKKINENVVSEHHTKNGLYESMEILNGIYNRLSLFNNERYDIKNYDYLNEETECKLMSLTRKEDKKVRIDGIFFKDYR